VATPLRAAVAALTLTAALLIAPSAALADPGSSDAPHATADDKATVGTYGDKGSPPTSGVSPGIRLKARAAAADDDCEAKAACYFYNTAYQDVLTTGVYANMYISNPTVVSPDSHSLAELAAIKHVNGTRQIVEVGWTVDRDRFGDGLPHLFVFSWVNGKGNCYDGCGWVASADSKVKAGDVLVPGSAKQFGIQYDEKSPEGGAWWIKYDGTYLGYFPSSLWTKADPPVPDFVDTDNVQAFGEVAAGTASPCSNMGVNKSKGADGAKGDPRPAYIASIAYVGGATVSPQMIIQPSTASSAYSINQASARTFFYGGGGFC
jgi:hypothetical protein